MESRPSYVNTGVEKLSPRKVLREFTCVSHVQYICCGQRHGESSEHPCIVSMGDVRRAVLEVDLLEFGVV